MDSSYIYDVLPLDAPDEDARWRQYVDVFRLTLLDTPPTEAQLEFFRRNRRKDDARLAMVTASTPAGDNVVAGFSSIVGRYNAGAQDVPTLIINTVGVNPAHRRRGLLRELMTQQLRQAKADGIPFATLSASEHTIYGRFGFGPLTRVGETVVDLAKFRLRPEIPVAPGRVEWVEPGFLAEHYWRVVDAFHERQLGSVRPYARTFFEHTGQWANDEQGPAKKLRAVAHFDEAGVVDGFATFENPSWEPPRRAKVHALFGATLGVEFALWQALASMDLVEQLGYFTQPGDPLPLGLVDERAVKVKEVEDWTWLRILDLPAAIAARSFERDGEAIIRVTDALGHCEGTWHLTVLGGRGAATPTTETPRLELDVAELARVWESNDSPVALARLGRIRGEAAAIRDFAGLFHRAEPSRNLTGY